MSKRLTQAEVNEIKEKYKPGMKIKLLKDMKFDEQPIKAGEIGVVDHVDDLGTIHMNWKSGSSLGIIPEIDEFEIVEKIKVIMLEVDKDPYVKEIYNTLEDKQELVGGDIECVPTFFSNDVMYDFVLNEEGKMNGLTYNRFIYDKRDAIAGDFMVIKANNEGEFVSLDDNEIDFLMNEIKQKCPKATMYELLMIAREEEEIER